MSEAKTFTDCLLPIQADMTRAKEYGKSFFISYEDLFGENNLSMARFLIKQNDERIKDLQESNIKLKAYEDRIKMRLSKRCKPRGKR